MAKKVTHPQSYFLFKTDGSFRPVSEGEFADDESDDTPVLVTTLGECRFRLRTDIYYFPTGYMELELTQPLERALKTFAGLLKVDQEADVEFHSK